MFPVRKACTFRASSLGDCLMGKYLLEEIRATHPDARLTLVVASNGAMIRELLGAYPWIVVAEANRSRPLALLALFGSLWRSDATVTQYSGRGTFSVLTKLFARLVTVRRRLVGFTDPWRWNALLFDHLLPVDLGKSWRLHEQSALAALDIPVTVKTLSLSYIKDASVHERFALAPGSYIIVHLFAGTPGRGLSEKGRRALLEQLVRAYGHQFTLVLTGGPSDRDAAKQAADGLQVRIIVGETTVQDMANLIVGSKAVVSVDTGIAHMAAHLSVPLVVLRTCIAKNWWSKDQYARESLLVLDADDGCRGGHPRELAKSCLNRIPTQDVIDSVSSLIYV